jgi:hypothetical protein
VSFINARLRRLEERGRGGRCPECKLPPDGPGRIVYVDDKRSQASLPSDERCPRCGRRLWCVIEVVGEGA